MKEKFVLRTINFFFVSKQEDIINPGTGTKKVLENFVDKWGKNELITGISLTDKNGVVIYNYSNISPVEIGTSLADRDYFIWAQSQINSDNYIVGNSVISVNQKIHRCLLTTRL